MSETVAATHHTAGKGSVMVRISILAVIAVVAPAPILHALGFGSIASFVGLAGLGGAVAVLVLGPRGGLIAAVGLGLGASLLTLASGTWWTAAVVMSLIAFVFGMSARRGWQSAFIQAAMALAFVASEGAKALDTLGQTAVVLGIAFFVWSAISAGLAYLFFRTPIIPPVPQPPRVVWGYIGMLTVVTFITQSLAIGLNLGHAGGWLVMTPFLVILPHIRDGFHKSLLRAGGTTTGFVIVIAVAAVISSNVVLYVIGLILFNAAFFAKLMKWNYFIYAMLLTPGIVILEGVSTSVTVEAEHRLEATLAAVGLSIAAMAILTVLNRKIPPSPDN